MWVTLPGVVLALIGLLGSLFIRPRRVWVRAAVRDGTTLVEVAALDRSGGGDLAAVARRVVDALQADGPARTEQHEGDAMTDAAWETPRATRRSPPRGVVYFLALLAHLVEWSALRTVPVEAVPVLGRRGLGGSTADRGSTDDRPDERTP